MQEAQHPDPNKNSTVDPENLVSGVDQNVDRVERPFDETSLQEAVDTGKLGTDPAGLGHLSDNEIALIKQLRDGSTPEQKKAPRKPRFSLGAKIGALTLAVVTTAGILGVAKPWKKDEVEAAPGPQNTYSASADPTPSTVPSAETSPSSETVPSSNASQSAETSATPEVVVKNETEALQTWLNTSYDKELVKSMPATERVKIMAYLKYLGNSGGLFGEHFAYTTPSGVEASDLLKPENGPNIMDNGQRFADHYQGNYQMAIAVTETGETMPIGSGTIDASNFDTIEKVASAFDYYADKKKAANKDNHSTYNDNVSALEDYFKNPEKHDTASKVSKAELYPNSEDYDDGEPLTDDDGEEFKTKIVHIDQQGKDYKDTFVIVPYDFIITDPWSGVDVRLTGNGLMRVSREDYDPSQSAG